MKLQIFDKVTCKQQTAKPLSRSIQVYKSNGSISFSSAAVLDLNISLDHKVIFAKDEDAKNQWYLAISKDFENGIKLRIKKNGGMCKDVDSLACSCRQVVDNMLSDFKAEKRAVLLIGSKPKEIEGVKWFPIIRKPLKTN